MTGTGFLPNTQLTFTVSFGGDPDGNMHKLNPTGPGGHAVVTDADGNFNSGTDASGTHTWIYLTCPARTLTVTATDGTNTGTWTGTIPVCAA